MRFHYLDSECKDIEPWCEYEPKCDDEYVQKKCPKLCGECKGKVCNKKQSIKTLAKPKYKTLQLVKDFDFFT